MTLEEKLIGRIRWGAANDAAVAADVERTAALLRTKGVSLEGLWEEGCRRNCYAMALAWRRMRRLALTEQADAELAALHAALRARIDEEVGQWQALRAAAVPETDEGAAARMQTGRACAEDAALAQMLLFDPERSFTYYFSLYPNIILERLLRRVEAADELLPQMLIKLLYASVWLPYKRGHSLRSMIQSHYSFPGGEYASDRFLRSFCREAAEHDRLRELYSALSIFPEVSLMALCEKSKDDFLRMAQAYSASIVGIQFYRSLLKAEGWSGEPLLDELAKLCTFSEEPAESALNDYLYLCWRLQQHPADAEAILAETALPAIPEGVAIPLRAMAAPIQETIHALLPVCPGQLLPFLRRMGRANPYMYQESEPFKKHAVWYNGSGKYLLNYLRCLEPLARSIGPQDMFDLYMNSDMKSMVDFLRVIKALFRGEDQLNVGAPLHVDLSRYLDKYRFFGSFLHNRHNDNYSVSASSISTHYKFPVHYIWAKDRTDYIAANLPDGAPVSFRLSYAGFNLTRRSGIMVFAVDVKPYRRATEGK